MGNGNRNQPKILYSGLVIVDDFRRNTGKWCPHFVLSVGNWACCLKWIWNVLLISTVHGLFHPFCSWQNGRPKITQILSYDFDCRRNLSKWMHFKEKPRFNRAIVGYLLKRNFSLKHVYSANICLNTEKCLVFYTETLPSNITLFAVSYFFFAYMEYLDILFWLW